MPVVNQDESDEMLSRGFKDQIYDVYRYLPPELQVFKYSVFALKSYMLAHDFRLEAVHNFGNRTAPVNLRMTSVLFVFSFSM